MSNPPSSKDSSVTSTPNPRFVNVTLAAVGIRLLSAPAVPIIEAPSVILTALSYVFIRGNLT